MKITHRHAPKEIPFGDVPIAGGFLYECEPYVKFLLPNGTPAGLDLTTGKSQAFQASTFVNPIEMEVIY